MILMKDIVREGHPSLRKKAEEVKFPLSIEDRELAEQILTYLIMSNDDDTAEEYDLRPGVGLAAPQVNASKRIFALHILEEEKETTSFIAINPKIVSHSVEKTYLSTGEGCLSVDRDIEGYVPRYKRISIEAYDLDGNKYKKRLRNLPAIAFQHELDHLNGIMFYDHIDPDKPFEEIPNSTPFIRD